MSRTSKSWHLSKKRKKKCYLWPNYTLCICVSISLSKLAIHHSSLRTERELIAQRSLNLKQREDCMINLREVKILKEQIASVSKSNRIYCIIVQKNMTNKDAFNYENIYKINKNKLLQLLKNSKVQEYKCLQFYMNKNANTDYLTFNKIHLFLFSLYDSVLINRPA